MIKYTNESEHLTLIINYDDSPQSPREWSNIGTFLAWQDRYNSPDKNNFNDMEEFFSEMIGEQTYENIYNKSTSVHQLFEMLQNAMDRKGYILYPITREEHGNVYYSIGTNQGWDVGIVGVYFTEKEKIYKEFEVKKISKKLREKIKFIVESEIEIYNQYANGEVWGYIVEKDNEIVDSCYGFYGDMNDKKEVFQTVNDYFPLGNFSELKEIKPQYIY